MERFAGASIVNVTSLSAGRSGSIACNPVVARLAAVACGARSIVTRVMRAEAISILIGAPPVVGSLRRIGTGASDAAAGAEAGEGFNTPADAATELTKLVHNGARLE